MVQAKSVSRTATKKASPVTRKPPAAKIPSSKGPGRRAPVVKAPAEEKAPQAPPARKPRARVKTLEAKAVVPVEPDAEAVQPEAEPFTPDVAPGAPDAQSQVVASKFAGVEPAPTKPQPRPSLPSTYGESRLLLLVRDPETLFAAWDVAPSTIEALRARLGHRGFAVSTQTLHLTRSDGSTSVVHAGKKARSRYVKIDGGPSFVAEIGFTTPAGRFEFVARSAPCFVPMGATARPDSTEASRRAVLGYREARALTRRDGLSPAAAGAPPRPSNDSFTTGGAAATPRTLGGASDLYRR